MWRYQILYIYSSRLYSDSVYEPQLDLKYEFPARNIERSSVEKQAASDPLAFLEDDGFEGLPNDESDYVKVHKEFFANNNTCNEAKESLMDLYLDDTVSTNVISFKSPTVVMHAC